MDPGHTGVHAVGEADTDAALGPFRRPTCPVHDRLLMRQLQLDDMEEAKTQNGAGTTEEDFSEFGDVRVISRPAPDAEDRLRRLFTLLLGSSAGDGQAESENDSPTDDRHSDDHVEAEA